MNNRFKLFALALFISCTFGGLQAQIWTNGGTNSNIIFPNGMNIRVGVGTGSPTAKLHVKGNGTQAALFEDGFVGIGTVMPIDELHLVHHHNDRTWMRIENKNGGNQASAGLSLGGFNDNIPGWNGVVHTYMGAGYQGNSAIGSSWQNKAVSYTGSGTAGYEFHLATANQKFFWSRRNGGTRQVDMMIDANGRIGIGTESPAAKLHVNGDLVVSDGSQAAGFVLVSDATGKASWQDPANLITGGGTPAPSAGCTNGISLQGSPISYCAAEALQTGSNGGDRLFIGSNGGSQPLSWGAFQSDRGGFASRTDNSFSSQIDYQPWNNKMIFRFSDVAASSYDEPVNFRNAMEIWGGNTANSTPRIYMGGSRNLSTAHENALLHVNGKLVAKSIYVTVDDWADFVFEKGYDLMPLEKVQEFISENGHLPNIPSATEVEADGVSLGDMNAKLLQKVEELTLYLLEMKEDKEKLESRLEKLETANN